MKISLDININQSNGAILESLDKLHSTLNKIIKTMAKAEQIQQLRDVLQTISQETTALAVTQENIAGDIQRLTDQLSEQDDIPQDILDGFSELATRVSSVSQSLRAVADITPEDAPVEPVDPDAPLSPDQA